MEPLFTPFQTISLPFSKNETVHQNTKGKKDKKATRPPNCFMIFSQENRTFVQAEFPNMSNSEVSKLLGERWRQLHPNKKKIYREKAETLKQENNQRSAPAVSSPPSPLSTKRTRENEESVSEPEVKKSKSDEQILATGYQPLQLPIDMCGDVFPEELYGDVSLDFIESLIEANRALNILAPEGLLV
jgi:hypothetical protein